MYRITTEIETASFSPVARILLIETPKPRKSNPKKDLSFSPVARILLIETADPTGDRRFWIGFSPVARILLIETSTVVK